MEEKIKLLGKAAGKGIPVFKNRHGTCEKVGCKTTGWGHK